MAKPKGGEGDGQKPRLYEVTLAITRVVGKSDGPCKFLTLIMYNSRLPSPRFRSIQSIFYTRRSTIRPRLRRELDKEGAVYIATSFDAGAVTMRF